MIELKSHIEVGLKHFLEIHIRQHLNAIEDKESKEGRQKVLELCHVGKFISFFEGYEIKEVTERPDFIIGDETVSIGLEHCELLHNKDRGYEGFWRTVFELAQKELKQEANMHDVFLACSLKDNLRYEMRQKNEFVSVVKSVISTYLQEGILIENPLIYHIWGSKHGFFLLEPHFGAFMQKVVIKEEIQKAITNKEKKLKKYRKEGLDEKWLCIVIGSSSSSSYEMDTSLDLSDIQSSFDRVFIMEDFNFRLYEAGI